MQPIKPYQLCMWLGDHQAEPSERPHKRLVETISYPFFESPLAAGRIKVRMVPGEPTTLSELPVSELAVEEYAFGKTQRGNIVVEYAHVSYAFCFPTDMLRYDDCHIYDHNFDTTQPAKDVLVYRVRRPRPVRSWTEARWRSFSAKIVPFKTFKLCHADHVGERTAANA
jgi:hypothetical protein